MGSTIIIHQLSVHLSAGLKNENQLANIRRRCLIFSFDLEEGVISLVLLRK